MFLKVLRANSSSNYYVIPVPRRPIVFYMVDKTKGTNSLIKYESAFIFEKNRS